METQELAALVINGVFAFAILPIGVLIFLSGLVQEDPERALVTTAGVVITIIGVVFLFGAFGMLPMWLPPLFCIGVMFLVGLLFWALTWYVKKVSGR